MHRKRDRSPSASSDEWTKLCLICWATVVDDENLDDDKSYVYAIILDPNLQTADADTITDEDGFILNPQPTVRFDGLGDSLAFCVSKSTLYIIESNNQSPSETFFSDMRSEDVRAFLQIEESARLELINKIPVKKTVYSFDLSQSDLSSTSKMVEVQKSELRKLPDMLGGKVEADAVVTPHGKILVFSKSIRRDFIDLPHMMVEFELYDPDTRVWSKLPQLYGHGHNNKEEVGSLIVWGSGFLTSSVYLVSTSHGNYVIDIDLEENERFWKKYEPPGLRSYVNDIYFIGEDGVCLTDYELKSTSDWVTLAKYPRESSFPKYIVEGALYANEVFTEINRLSALMDKVDGGGCFKFCCIQTVHHKGGFGHPRCSIPFFILDVFRAKRDKEANKFITSPETCLKFSPKNLGDLDVFFNLRFFSVQFSTRTC